MKLISRPLMEENDRRLIEEAISSLREFGSAGDIRYLENAEMAIAKLKNTLKELLELGGGDLYVNRK